MCNGFDYPQAGAYRGISTYDFFDDPDYEFIHQGAFQFSDFGREDDIKECSIHEDTVGSI